MHTPQSFEWFTWTKHGENGNSSPAFDFWTAFFFFHFFLSFKLGRFLKTTTLDIACIADCGHLSHSLPLWLVLLWFSMFSRAPSTLGVSVSNAHFHPTVMHVPQWCAIMRSACHHVFEKWLSTCRQLTWTPSCNARREEGSTWSRDSTSRQYCLNI